MLDLSRLSAAQRQAVLEPDGPVLILAGPGSGKTLVLAAKVAYLVTWRQIPPTSILAVTFAAKAAQELRSRLRGLLGDQGTSVDVSTFHALGLRIVTQWSEELGMGLGPPTVYGTSQVRAVLRDVAAALHFDLDRYPPRELSSRLERVRLNGEREVREANALQPIADAYEEILRRQRAVDYPAMLTLPLQLFREHPRVLSVCQDSYRVLLCDEFQDICASQYRFLRYLAARHHNVIVVGDPQQTLYGWRGAHTRFLDEFRSDFPETKIIGLHQNFRSTRQIVDLANALSACLSSSRPLWTHNSSGDTIRFHSAVDERAEALFVANEIESLLTARIVERLDQVAILYRMNWQALTFTLALRERGLPHQSSGHAPGQRPDGELDIRQPDQQLHGVEVSEADSSEGITLSTVHRAKGGEWKVVFVVGMEEGLLPHARAIANYENERASLDDERRVAYVAVTRARERLYLTCCRTRRRGNRIEPREPSRFLRGLALDRDTRIA